MPQPWLWACWGPWQCPGLESVLPKPSVEGFAVSPLEPHPTSLLQNVGLLPRE